MRSLRCDASALRLPLTVARLTSATGCRLGGGAHTRLLTGSADYLTSYLRGWLSGLAERSASGLPFVRSVEWDYQSALGERRWSTGLSALGALREGGDDAVVWQMRAFAAEESAKGANAGLIYRRVAGGGLIGVNTFLDYENSGDYDKAFWRGSLGAEYRSAIVNVYLNRYFGITDGVQLEDGGWVYTQDGTDAELDIQVPDFPLGGFSGGVTYYRWEGEYGDEDDKGFRYHLQLKPAFLGSRLRFRLELDSPDDGSVDWGGAVSYSYLFGAPAPAAAAAAASGFDPRAHFFDPVRREYSQRIVRSAGGGGQINYEWVAGTAYLSPVGADAVTLTAAADARDFPRPHTITAATEAASTLRVAANTAGEGWAVSVYQLGTVVFTAEDRTNISIVAGTITVQQSGSDIGTVLLTTAEIALLSAALEIGLNSAGDEIFIELEEGGVDAVVPYGISVLAAHGGETVTVTAGIAAGIRAEIRIVDGAITVISEEQLPIGTVRSRYEWVAGTSYVSPVGADAVTLTEAADNQDFPRPHTITAATEAVSTLRVASERAGWAVSVYQSGRVVFTAEDRTNISIVAGTITVQQSGSDIRAVHLATAEIALRGAALEIGLNSGGDEIFIELEEGGVDAVVPYGDIRVLAAHGGETVTVVAGVVAGIRAEIRIVDGAITVISEEELPIGTVRSRYEWVAGTSYVSPVGADAATLTAAADARDFPRPHTITAATEAVSTLRVASERAGWAVSVYQLGRVVFTAEDRTNISIVAGTITVQQSGSDIGAVRLAAAEITLRGAALEIGLNSGGDEIFIELEEGGVDAVVPYGDIRVLAAHGGEVVTVTADSLGGVKAEIRIVNGAIMVMSEQLPIRPRIVVVGGVEGISFNDNVWSSTGAGESLTLAGPDSFRIGIGGAALVALGGTLYLSGGLDGSLNALNAVWHSVDGGASWVSVGVFSDTSRASHSHSMVSYNDKLYIIGGQQSFSSPSFGDVFSSSDGVNWELAGTIETTLTVAGGTGGHGRAVAVHNNTLFIIGGQTSDNQFRASYFTDSFAIDKDGTIHTLTVSNNLPAYGRAVAVSFKGTIYRIGGQDSDSKSQNDIWSSADGQNWTRLGDFPENISGHQALVYGEGIYVLGGEDSEAYNRVWYSTNATDWIELSNMPGARSFHAATVFPTPSP